MWLKKNVQEPFVEKRYRIHTRYNLAQHTLSFILKYKDFFYSPPCRLFYTPKPTKARIPIQMNSPVHVSSDNLTRAFRLWGVHMHLCSCFACPPWCLGCNVWIVPPSESDIEREARVAYSRTETCSRTDLSSTLFQFKRPCWTFLWSRAAFYNLFEAVSRLQRIAIERWSIFL